MEKEIRRRLNILNAIKVPKIDARMLRGGMQKRLYRQEILRHQGKIENQKGKLNRRLSLIEQERELELERESNDFGIFPRSSREPLEEFNEPTFRRIRSKRGFFNE